MVTQSKYDMLLAIPTEIVQAYFPRNTEQDYQKAAKHLERKLKQFEDNFESRLYPVSGKYILHHFQKLCETMPELMCSIAFMGKDEAGYTFPVVQNEAIEIKPAWEPLNFELIIQVERHLQAIGQNLLRIKLGPDEKQKVYGDLKRQIENLAGARHYRDIRGIYGLLYSELRLILKGLYQNMEHEWVFDKDKIDNLSTWIALRDDQFFILKLAQKLSSRIKTLVEFDKKAEIAIRTLTDSFKSLNAGESVKLLSYDDQPIDIPGRVVDSGNGTTEKLIDEFDTLEIELPGDMYSDKSVKFWLSNDTQSTDSGILTVTQASLLLFLAAERIADEEYWLSNPGENAAQMVLEDISDELHLGKNFEYEMQVDRKPEYARTWIWDFNNTYRKTLVSQINRELHRAGCKGSLLTSRSPQQVARVGNYSLHKAITKIRCPLF